MAARLEGIMSIFVENLDVVDEVVFELVRLFTDEAHLALRMEVLVVSLQVPFPSEIFSTQTTESHVPLLLGAHSLLVVSICSEN